MMSVLTCNALINRGVYLSNPAFGLNVEVLEDGRQDLRKEVSDGALLVLDLLVITAAGIGQAFQGLGGRKGTGKTGSVPVLRRLSFGQKRLARILEAVGVWPESDVASPVNHHSGRVGRRHR